MSIIGKLAAFSKPIHGDTTQHGVAMDGSFEPGANVHKIHPLPDNHTKPKQRPLFNVTAVEHTVSETLKSGREGRESRQEYHDSMMLALIEKEARNVYRTNPRSKASLLSFRSMFGSNGLRAMPQNPNATLEPVAEPAKAFGDISQTCILLKANLEPQANFWPSSQIDKTQNPPFQAQNTPHIGLTQIERPGESEAFDSCDEPKTVLRFVRRLTARYLKVRLGKPNTITRFSETMGGGY
jgi:hypothetical protein